MPAAAEDYRMAMIALTGLRKSYREGGKQRVVLNDASAVVGAGEIVALVGKSGSGKSTLLNLISGMDLPDAGEIRVADVVVTRLTEHERTLFRRRHVGLVFQFFNLIPTLTVAENLLLPLELNNLLTPEKQAGITQLLREVGLESRRDSYPDVLSGGEQQRIALLRALIHEPRLLLADEPTGNLDADTGRVVIALLLRLARQRQMTVVIVTHSNEVAAIADRRLEMHDGALREPGPGHA
ncbi:MAG: putative ABC transport system ATP-binding protein [Gammaproteobacteria bacterium]|nr:MAG: putative ABC transport system ATP-binding protein [Gammaproteobacteria bacterium]TND05758.1 MAG: putative ABC transport system ATP-binding protein [Gammaproteobacteria bacterium]